MNQAKKNSINVTPIINENEVKIRVTWDFSILYKETEGGHYACYVPSIDLYYSASEEIMIREKANKLVEDYFGVFLSERGFDGYINFLKQLENLGFRSWRHTEEMRKIVREKTVKEAKYKAPENEIPFFYKDAEETIGANSIIVKEAA